MKPIKLTFPDQPILPDSSITKIIDMCFSDEFQVHNFTRDSGIVTMIVDAPDEIHEELAKYHEPKMALSIVDGFDTGDEDLKDWFIEPVQESDLGN